MCAKLCFYKIFVDTLITMSNRIRKQRKHSSVFKKVFLSRIIAISKEMPICENYFKHRFQSYTISPLDSSYYIEYIWSNRSGYNIIGPTATQFETLSSIHIRFETKLEDTLEKQI